MRSRLRLFLLVGLLATAVDVGLFLLLEDIGLVPADLIALALAALLSYLLNRNLTFRGKRSARWVRRPSAFAATAGAAAAVDLAVLSLAAWAGLALFPAKVVAVVAAAVIRWIAYRRILFYEVRRELALRVDRPPAPGELRLTVVVPAYNEERLIAQTVSALKEDLGARLHADSFEVLVVDDGSPDRTSEVAANTGARVLTLNRNQGKGAAVRAGVLDARGRAVIFTDADLAYPPAMILDLLDRLEQGWDVVVGSRRHDDTNTLVRARRIRELGGRIINLLTHVVLLGQFHDTQCGIKGFRSDIGRAIFERTRIDGFAFDVEIFLVAEQDQLSLTEVPVSVINRAGSSVSLVGDTVDLLVDLFKIRRWAGAGKYRPTLAQIEVLEARTGS